MLNGAQACEARDGNDIAAQRATHGQPRRQDAREGSRMDRTRMGRTRMGRTRMGRLA